MGRASAERASYQRRGLALLLGAATAVCALIGTAWYFDRTAIELDPETLCPVVTELVPRHVVVAVDQTDSLTAAQVGFIRDRVESIRDDSATHTRISLLLVGETVPRPPRTVFTLCKPMQGDDANELYQNAERIQARFDEDFDVPLQCALWRVTRRREAPRSPLLEHLEAIASWSAFRAVPDRRIVFVSDYLENSADFSHYAEPAPSLGGVAPLSLADVGVQMVYLMRRGQEARQTEAHRADWRAFLEGRGARMLPSPDSLVGWASGLTRMAGGEGRVPAACGEV